MEILMELRLKKRYEQLVRTHMQVGNSVAAGVKSILNNDEAFNQTQAAWRFFNNDACSLQELSQPLLKAAHELSETECDNFILMLHDWSTLGYNAHKSKKDTYNVFKACVGYDLQSSLAVSDRHGGPLALVAMNLKTKDERLSNYGENLEGLTHLEELSKRIGWIESQNFNKPLVHIVDREASSVAFMRTFKSKNWLIRENDNNIVNDGISEKKIKDIAKNLSFSQARIVEHKGIPANQQIAETEIIITRPAKQKRKGPEGKRLSIVIKGEPVKARLIVSRVIDNLGNELSIWYLLSNMHDVPAATLALWYYWRWSVEKYFKLMKSAGMQLESWQQTTGLAIARRLLVASMACVSVWRIAHATGPKAGELRRVLVRLSGRQMKRKVEFTYNALLAGLWALLAMQDMLNNYNIEEIKSLLKDAVEEMGLV